MSERKVWIGRVPCFDDFGEPVTDKFIDGKTKFGPWAIMAPASYNVHGVGIGLGMGQVYVKDYPTSVWYKLK